MIPCVHGKTIAVMGLGRSGSSAARMLALSGATVWAWDDSERSRAEAKAHGIAVTDLAKADLSLAAFMVWSPGIPHTHPMPHPVAEAARKAGLPLLCDIDLLALAAPRARYVGITGTNGKSTTTTLTAHILKNAGYKVAVGGNLGTPALDLDDTTPPEVKSTRLSRLQKRIDEQAQVISKAMVGSVQRVLVEGTSRKDVLEMAAVREPSVRAPVRSPFLRRMRATEATETEERTEPGK